MIAYVGKAQRLIQQLGDIKIKQIGQEENAHADSLANLATSVRSRLRREILIDFQSSPRIGDPRAMCTKQGTDDPNWMTPIVEYLKEGSLPEDGKES